MEKILNDCIEIFENLGGMEYTINPNDGSLLQPDLDDYSHEIYQQTHDFQNSITKAYLNGNDNFLKRLRGQLLELLETKKNEPFGMIIRIEETGKQVIIEPEYMASIFKIHTQYILQLIHFIDNIGNSQPTQPAKFTGFQTTLHPDKFTPLLTMLIETGYIAPGTDFKSFTACFNGLPLPDNFAPVQWIKRPKRGKNTPAKKALTDLLTLMGTPKEQTRDNLKLKTFFVDYTGNPLIFTQSNFDNSKDFKDNSEYFPELQNIINSL